MKPDAAKTLRCAIYTRVSTEHGLEQEFNSLDNQREAAEAYIKSQAHEGWRGLRERYNDGGFSGASMQRPALRQLLAEIRSRRIDVVVVYKVDASRDRSPTSPSWSSSSMSTGSRLSPSPRPSTPRPAWGG
jgi:site-specific DNA recombinase